MLHNVWIIISSSNNRHMFRNSVWGKLLLDVTRLIFCNQSVSYIHDMTSCKCIFFLITLTMEQYQTYLQAGTELERSFWFASDFLMVVIVRYKKLFFTSNATQHYRALNLDKP